MPRSDSAELTHQLADAQVEILYSRNRTPGILGLPFALVLVFGFWRELPHGPALAWLAIKFAAVAIRFFLGQRYLSARSTADAATWTRRYVVSLAIDGFAWALLGMWFTPLDGTLMTSVLVGAIVGVSAIGNVALSAHFAGNVAFSSSLLLPVALYQAVLGGRLGLFLGIALCILLFFILLEGRRGARDTLELLRLRFEIDLTAAQRAEALELAQQHSAAKDRFLSTMSHEMRTPLHGILGSMRLLRDSLSDPKQLDRVSLIERSGDHLLSVINDVLDYSRIDAGGLQLRESVFDLAQLLEDVQALFAAAASARSLELQLEPRLPAPCWIQGDAARVRQVVINLVGNAIKFTERGMIRIGAVVAGTQLRITVADTGPGIPAEDLPRIFEAFKQADNGYSRRVEGTGLGLTISKNLALAMKGDLSCASTQGLGSMFTFELPYTWAPAPSAAPESLPPLPRLLGRVLLAEDNEINVMVALWGLQKLGLTVEVARDGAAAIALHKAQGPDLILIDCHMPGIDGFTAATRIREQERALGMKRAAIIAATASTGDELRARCLQAGMDELLTKPFDVPTLANLLARFLPPDTRPATNPVLRAVSRPLIKAISNPSAKAISNPTAKAISKPTVKVISNPTAQALRSPLPLGITERDEAIRRLGDVTFYDELLAAFRRDQRDAFPQIQSAITAGELSEAARRAHNLVGLAGIIGAPALRKASRRLEELLRQEASAEARTQACDDLKRELDFTLLDS